MKKTYGYLPLWFLLIFPPLLVLTLAVNFISAGLSLLFGAILLKIKNPFDNYYKKIIRTFILTLEVDIICVIFYALPELLSKISFFNNNLTKPLEYNPYKNLMSFIYILFLFILIFVFIYHKINKKVLKNFEKTDDKIRANILMTIVLIPYLFFIPSTLIIPVNKSNLDDFKGTVMTDNTSVVQLLNNLTLTKYISSYVLETNVRPYTLNIYLNKIDKNYQKMMEIDAATIFMLISDVNEVKFYMNNNTYTYKINRINEIFDDIKKKTLIDIHDRYNNDLFKNKHYLGRLNGYDVFDIGKGKETEVSVCTDSKIHYYLEATNIKNVNLYKDGKLYKNLKTALDDNDINTDDLKNSDLEIILTGLESDENENNNK